MKAKQPPLVKPTSSPGPKHLEFLKLLLSKGVLGPKDTIRTIRAIKEVL